MGNPIVSISVRRKKRNVCFIPRYIVALLPSDWHVVSIEYFDSDRPALDRFASSFKISHAGEAVEGYLPDVLDYVAGLDGANVAVHCEAGYVRSRFMAARIVDKYNYTLVGSIALTDGTSHRVGGFFRGLH